MAVGKNMAACRRISALQLGCLLVAVLSLSATSNAQRGLKPPAIIKVSFTQSTYSVSEGAGNVEVCLQADMTSLPLEAVQAVITSSELQGVAQSATDGTDFSATSRTVTVTLDVGGMACALFPILADSLALEGDEEFQVSFAFIGQTDVNGVLTLSNGRDLAVPGKVATVVILDENVVTVDLTEAEYRVGEGGGQVEVCLSLDIPIAMPLTVHVEATQDIPISATDQLDFLSAIEPVRFEAVGETNFSSPHTSCAFFAILDDKIAFEGEEGFVVGIQAPSGAEYQIGTNSTANVTILDNDAVSLTYQIVGRPEGIRPITGETVIFTCEVEGDLLTWESPAQVIDGGTRTIAINNMVGEVLNDTVSGGTFTRLPAGSNRFRSILTFPNADPALLNNTLIRCVDRDMRENNDTIYMAGIPSSPIGPRQSNMTCDCINITWDTPLFDGAAPLTTIVIRFYPTSNASRLVELRTGSGSDTRLEICDLVPNEVYNVSILALNRVGVSTAEEFVMVIVATEPFPPEQLSVDSVCANPTLCFDGSVLATWKTPLGNSDILCPVLRTLVSYIIIELGDPENSTFVTLPPGAINYTINPLLPGTSYIVQVSYFNEVGESRNNPEDRKDVLLFSSFLIVKAAGPGTIMEGEQVVYNVKLNGPPPSGVGMDGISLDQLTTISGFPLRFNTSNWFLDQNLVIMAVDDDVIMESPYGAVLSMESFSSRADFNKRINLTLGITEGDRADVIIRRKEVYPDPLAIPEGRWEVYLVTLPNRPYFPVTITFFTLTPTITSSPRQIRIEPEFWDVPQELTVIAVEDDENRDSTYRTGFKMALESEDGNYNGQNLPDFNVTVEDNDEDSDVVSGTLTWVASPESARTAVTLYLTLTLLRSRYPNITSSQVGMATIPIPGTLKFGDGNSAESSDLLTVQSVDEDSGYVVGSASILHVYPHAHHYGRPWSAEYEYCCKGKNLQNNQETVFSVTAEVDLTFPSSPLLPTLTAVTFHRSAVLQEFFFSAFHPEGHPLLYGFGTPSDYHSSQSGTPQGLEISYATGRVTWNTSSIMPGRYNVKVVVLDAFTNIRMTAELLLIVATPIQPTNLPPTILSSSPYLPHDVIYISPNTSLSVTLTISDPNTALSCALRAVLPLPNGAGILGPVPRGPRTAEATFQWLPTDAQLGARILCFVASDAYGAKSSPACLVIVVAREFEEQPVLILNYPGLEMFQQNFTRGIDESVSITHEGASLTLAPLATNLEHMYITLINHGDGSQEKFIPDPNFSHPSLTYGVTSFLQEEAQVVYFRGRASTDVYLSALRSVNYTNAKLSPTIGDRVVVVTVYDGISTNALTLNASSLSVIAVSIDNAMPQITVSGGDESYNSRYFPFKGPVPAINPAEARVIDTDSTAIQSAVLQLSNVQNFQNEVLSVTYVSPDRLSLPLIAEALSLEIPFGNLSARRQLVPANTSTISVPPHHTVRAVGEVNVIVDIRHSWVGDLKLELEHDGRRETLVMSPGGQVCARDDLFRTVFDSDASSGVFLSKSLQSPGLCRFQSQGVFSPDGNLGNFRGDAVEGEWSLHVTDLLLENDNGRLVSWGLVIWPEEFHTFVRHPPVVPPLPVSISRGYEQKHMKEVAADGKIVELAVQVQLAVSSLATRLYLPSIKLVHPDSTEVVLADSSIPLCAVGNFSYIIFDDRSRGRSYSCAEVLSLSQAGSGSASGSGSTSGLGVDLSLGTDSSMDEIGTVMSSGSGSGSGLTITYDDLMNMNITIPTKHTLADLLTPVTPLSTLNGKMAAGKWTLVLSSSHELDSTLVGWSLRMSREPNIVPLYNSTSNTLTLSGADSVDNYEKVLRSVVYDNIADRPDFSTVRLVETTVFDGEQYSNISASSSRSYITVHHIDIDLDPNDISAAGALGYAAPFQEHGNPIPVLDPENAQLRDDAFSEGQYTLTVRLTGYQNLDEEGLIWDISQTPHLLNSTMDDVFGEEIVVTVFSEQGNLRPIEEFQSVLRSFEYYNSAEELIGTGRSIEFSVSDVQMNSDFISDTATANITFQPTNDLPVLILNSHLYTALSQFSNQVEFTEGQGAIPLANSSAISLTDNDHTHLASVTVTIENPQDGNSELLSANSSGTFISSSYNISVHTLTLIGTDTLDSYVSVIATVTYDNTVHSPGLPGTEPRRISFVPYDGIHQGLPAVARVTFATVNDAPMGDLNGALSGTGLSVNFMEEGSPVMLLSPNASFSDADNSSLAYVEVVITNPLDAPLEVLSVRNVVETTDPNLKVVTVINLRPITSYNNITGTLRISGLDSIAEYEQVLKTLTYVNLADEPNPTTRLLSLTLHDGYSPSDPLAINITIQLLNDSPFFKSDARPVEPEIDEDVPLLENHGVSVTELTTLIGDDDVGARLGVVVTDLDSRNGVWEYTLDGMEWNSIQMNVSRGYGLGLESDGNNSVRFVPDKDHNGITAFTIVAWDLTNGAMSGNYINAVSNSVRDPFSAESRVIRLRINPVNDAPVLQEVPIQLTTILEDDHNSTGDAVISLLRYASDVDRHEQLGIAVIEAGQENGTWQFTNDGGSTWEEFGNVSDTSALVMWSLPAEMRRVRFVPDPNYNGMASFQFLAWDLTVLPESSQTSVMSGVGPAIVISSGSGSGSGSGFQSGSGSGDLFSSEISNSTSGPDFIPPYPSGTRFINTTLSDAVTGPFSVNSTSAAVTIGPVNDSPVIFPGMMLHDISEKTPIDMNHGTRIADIIDGFYMDVDASNDRGLAVVGVDNRFGEWQYTCDTPGVGQWMAFIGGRFDNIILPRVRPEMATLLLSHCWIRFVPDPFFNTMLDTLGFSRPSSDVPYIVAHGWDNTGLTMGRNGSYGVDVSRASSSDINEFSSSANRISIQIISVNDVPILYLSNSTLASFETVYVEDGLPVPAVGQDLTLIDNDHAMLRDVTITIRGSVFDQSPFSGVDFGESFSGDLVALSDISGSGSGSGSGSSGGSFSGTGMENVTSMYVPVVSSAPSLPPLHRIVEHVRNMSSPSFNELYCAGLVTRREELLIQTIMLDLNSEVLSYCPYVLRIFPDPSISPEAHVAMFQLALRSLRYNNSLEEPEGGDRTLTFMVSDNVGLSSPVNSTIFVMNVNDRPQLDLNDHIPDLYNFVSFTEGQGEIVLANASALRLVDHDNAYLQSARVALLEAPDSDHEVLNATSETGNIDISYSNATLTLTLIGNATLMEYAMTLSTVTYDNLYSMPGNPDERQRQVEFTVNDGELDSVVATAFISFKGINDRPFIDVNGNIPGTDFNVTFIEERGPIPIVSPDAVVHDEDNGTLAYIVVKILNPDFGTEFLAVDSVRLVQVLQRNMYDIDKVIQITNLVPNMTYDEMAETLVIRGLDTVEEFQMVLQTITYDNTEDEPVPVCRDVEFIANDGELNSSAAYTRMCIQLANDSPRNNNTVTSVYSPLILEDELDPVGISVFSFARGLFEDDDSPPPGRGIAIISVEVESGDWEYRTNGGSEWFRIQSTTSIDFSLLLSAEAHREDYIRFLPNPDFNGNASVTFVGWDGSLGMPSGSMRSARSRNGTDPFSEDTRTMVLRIVPVNDAPVIDPTIEPRMTTILEDERESLGDDVASFLLPLTNDVDVDVSQHEFGIAITGADFGNGYWQFSVDAGTRNWSNVTDPSVSSAVVLTSQPPGQNRIRFVPDPDFNGTSSFQYKMWDRNETWPSGTSGIDTNTNPVTGTFSVAMATSRITLDPINDSPTVRGTAMLTAIQENIAENINSGTTVDILLRGVFQDVDGLGVGMAVLYVDRRNGDWQYTCEVGSQVTWRSFIGQRLNFDSIFGRVSQLGPVDPNEFRATLLEGGCRIRFLPNPLFNTEFNLDGSLRPPNSTPFISIRGWDMTSGSNMDIGIDTTSTPDDYTNAFSNEIINVTISVSSRNNPPLLNLNGEFRDYRTAFTEAVPPERNVIPVPVVNRDTFSLTDMDNASLASAIVTFEVYDTDQENLTVDVTGTSLAYSISIIGLNMYFLRITPLNGVSAPIGDFQRVISSVHYLNSKEEPNPAIRRIEFRISDGISFNLPFAVTEVLIQLVNDPPQFDLSGSMPWPDSYSFLTYREGQGSIPIINSNATLVDFDDDVIQSARVVILSPPDGNSETLNASSVHDNITVTHGFNRSELLLSGSAATDDYLSVLMTITYEHLLSNPSTISRTIQFTVSDGKNNSLPAFVYLSFSGTNNPPVLDLNGNMTGRNYRMVFREEEDPVIIVSEDMRLEDIDDTNLAYVEVRILNPVDGENEVLFVEDVVQTSAPLDRKHVTFWNYRPTQLYDSVNATLRITGLDSVYEYQEVLKTLQYNNLADEPSSITRNVEFFVSDGLLVTSGVFTYVEIVNINDSPFFNSSAPPFSASIFEDVVDFDNPGWSVEDLIASELILDDDMDPERGIALVGMDDENGHWEVTWDFTTDESEFRSRVGLSGSGMESSGSGSGSGQSLSPNSGSGMENGGSSQPTQLTPSVNSGSGSGSGQFALSGSGSGIAPTDAEIPLPKCPPSVFPTRPPTVRTFYANWQQLPSNTSSAMATVVRAAGNRTRVRFVPLKDYEGESTLTFKAWDVTDSLSDGAITNTTSSSVTDPYSSQSVTITIIVEMVNDAPLLSNLTFNLTEITEDDTSSFGDDVSELVVGVSDVDMTDSIFGIAVVLVDEENGDWQFSTDGGNSWTTMSMVCPNNATVLRSEPMGENRIRFRPFRDFNNGYASFSFVAWDLTSGEDSGVIGVDTTIYYPVTSPYSRTMTTATIRVDAENDSPVLTQGAMLADILEDTPPLENNGTLVLDIVNGTYYDVDVNSEVGIAVIGVDPRYGTWEWRCPDSNSWNEFFGDFIYMIRVPFYPRPEKATLLGGDCRIRFLPILHFNTLRDTSGRLRPQEDLPYIEILGWDNTGLTRGFSGMYGVDTTYNNDSITNEFSADSRRAVVNVISVNDLVEVRITSDGSGTSYRTQFTEEQDFVRIVEPEAVFISDSDHANLDSILVTVTNSLDPGMEVLYLQPLPAATDIQIDQDSMVASVTIADPGGQNRIEQIQILMNIFSEQSPQPSSLRLTAPPGMPRASVEAYQAILALVVYDNHHNEPNNSTRLIQFSVDDLEQNNTMVTTMVDILLLNDNSPLLTNYISYQEFTEGDDMPAPIASENLTLTDSDHNEYFFMTNATIQLTPIPLSPNENVSVDATSLPPGINVSQYYDPLTGELAITGSAHISVYEGLLRTAVYQNTIEEPVPGVRMVTMQVYDGNNPSNIQRVAVNMILINDRAPVITTSDSPFVFTERGSPVSISDGITITDPDSGDTSQMNVTITITNAIDGESELLNVTTFGDITSSFESTESQSILVLTGPASLDLFQNTLSSLTYVNLAEEPNQATRRIEVLANDGDFNSSVQIILVEIDLVNDIPVISIPPRETVVNYVEGDGPIAIASNITLSDNDNSKLVLATVILRNMLDMPDELLNLSTTDGANISTNYDPNTGVLMLSGNALLVDYQETLRTLTYENLRANPGFPNTDPRMIVFAVFDGFNYSMDFTITLTFDSVNDAPRLDLNGPNEIGTDYNTTFTEEGEAVFVTDRDVILFDIDNTSLSYINITILNRLDGSNEVLSVTLNSSDDANLPFVSYEEGSLFIAGLDLVDSFEAALAAVTYTNLADEPDYSTRIRTLLIVASDGLIESENYYTNIELIPVNDPPCLFIAGDERPLPTTSEPPTTLEPLMTSEPPTNGSVNIGSGSGTPQTSSGSGLGPGMQSGSGSGVGSGSGMGLGMMSGSGSGMGDFANDTAGPVQNTTAPPTTTPTPTIDPAAMFENVSLVSLADFSTFYAENSLPVPITNARGVLIKDDDNSVLARLEVILYGVRDSGFETIFFDSNSLSRSLVRRIYQAAESNLGYLGDDTTCVPGSGNLMFEEIDLRINLTLREWEEVVRSLRYCSSDHNPVSGTRTVSFRIQDPEGAWSNEQNATVEVFAINDAPICSTPVNMFTIDEDTNITISVVSNCFDHEENLTGQSIFIFSLPPQGVVQLDSSNGDILFLPAQDDHGVRRFAYQACDSEGACSTPQVVTVVINPINDPPYAVDNLRLFVGEDTPTTVPLTLYFGDVEDDLIPGNFYPRVMTITGNTGGGFILQNDTNSTLTYNPFDDFIGRDILVLEVCDSVGVCINITLTVTVMSINDPPDFIIQYPAGASFFTTPEDTLISMPIQVRDIEDDSFIDVVVVSVGNGTAQTNLSQLTFSRVGVRDRFVQSMAIDYTPDKNFFGDDFVVIEATDSSGNSTQATINVRVLYINDPPIFGVSDITILEDVVTTWNLPSDLRISDPEDVLNAGSFTIVEQPLLGNLTYMFDEEQFLRTGIYPERGVLTYYPPLHFFTNESEFVTFTLQACDNNTITVPICVRNTFRLTILSVNDAPRLPRLNFELYEDNPLRVNLWEFTSDVEEGRPPMANITLVEPFPVRGMATYDPLTGYLDYTPHLNEYGTDFIYYNACDSQNRCSDVEGEIQLSLLEVNDAPNAMNFVHIAREDDFDLIAFYSNITDNETANLRIEIVDDTGGGYVDVWTTAIGGMLRVYHAHQIITYLPPADYVGPDTFRYSVCDTCDPRRDQELGRVGTDLQCQRQIEENGGNLTTSDGVYVTCAEAMVEVVVANINDVPVIGDIAGVTKGGAPLVFTPFENAFVQSDTNLSVFESIGSYFYRNLSASIYEPDDEQVYFAAQNGLNLTLYNLENDTDIDELSLRVLDNPSSGAVSVSTVDRVNRLTYIPRELYSGYDSFRYEICDKARVGGDGSRCADGIARIWVTSPGPSFNSLTALGAMESGQFTDSKIGTGDIYSLMFSEPTNMPPRGTMNTLLTAQEVNQIFSFDPPFFLNDISPVPYTGQWVSPTEFQIKIVNEGYPTPFQTRISGVGAGRVMTLSSVKVGEWQVAVNSERGPCGGFDSTGQLMANTDPYCLLNADGTSLQSQSISPTLQGDYGLRLPNISNVIIRNVAVDDSILVVDLSSKFLFQKSQISILLQPPLSYDQLATYCERDASDILRVNRLGDSVDLIVVGCANLLSNGSNADVVYSENVDLMRQTFLIDENARGRRDASLEDGSNVRVRRQIAGGSPQTYPLPVASEVVLQLNSITNPRADPASDLVGFVTLIQQSFNFGTVAQVIFETLGVAIDSLQQYSGSTPLSLNTSFYYEFDDDLTPQIVLVEAADPDNADIEFSNGDTITIFFDRSTDQPNVVTKADLDRIFIFNPGLGNDYRGFWVSPSVLQITIVDAGDNSRIKLTTNPVNFTLAFTPNYFHTGNVVTDNNTILPTETPWCVGVSVCGTRTLSGGMARTIGICSANGLSCRAHQGWTDLSGNFGNGRGIPSTVFPWWWIAIAIVVAILIVVLIVVAYFIYRYYTHKAVRKEALRVIRRWKKDQFAPGKEPTEKKDEPKPWVKPPDVSTMRGNPDPFDGTLRKLPEVVQRPPTAMIEAEHLPPVPQHPFRPRALPQIRPSVASLQSVTRQPIPRRTFSTGSLPPGLNLPPLAQSPTGPPKTLEAPLFLPPLRGGAVGFQASRALGDQSQGAGGIGGGTMPAAILPHRLPSLRSPTATVTTLGTIAESKGKGPSNGRPSVKKSPHASSEEDVNGAEGRGSGTALSPPFSPTRPLPSLGPMAINTPLPPIGGGAGMGRLTPIRRPPPTLQDLPVTMSPRRVSTDPFTLEPLSPIQPADHQSPTQNVPHRPSRVQTPQARDEATPNNQ